MDMSHAQAAESWSKASRARQRQGGMGDRSRSEYKLCGSVEQQDAEPNPLQKIFMLFHSTTQFELQVRGGAGPPARRRPLPTTRPCAPPLRAAPC
jgi:hypothetical protein